MEEGCNIIIIIKKLSLFTMVIFFSDLYECAKCDYFTMVTECGRGDAGFPQMGCPLKGFLPCCTYPPFPLLPSGLEQGRALIVSPQSGSTPFLGRTQNTLHARRQPPL